MFAFATLLLTVPALAVDGTCTCTTYCNNPEAAWPHAGTCHGSDTACDCTSCPDLLTDYNCTKPEGGQSPGSQPAANMSVADTGVAYWETYCQNETRCQDYNETQGAYCDEPKGTCHGCSNIVTCGKFTCVSGKCTMVAGNYPFEDNTCGPCPIHTSVSTNTPLPALDPVPGKGTLPTSGPIFEARHKVVQRKPARSGRDFWLTLWHEGIVGPVASNTSESAIYVEDMIAFVDQKQLDRVYLQAQDPTVTKYGKPLFAYAQPDFVVNQYLARIDALNQAIDDQYAKIEAGLLVVVNPSYPWAYNTTLPGGMLYNNPGYTDPAPANVTCQTPIRQCHRDDQCFQDATCGAIKYWCDADATTISDINVAWAENATVTYLSSASATYLNGTVEHYSADTSVSYLKGTNITWPGGIHVTWTAGNAPSWGNVTGSIQVSGCCQSFDFGCPNNYEQAFKYIGDINQMAKELGLLSFITTVALDGEDISQYGTDPLGMTQAWQAALKYAPDVIEIGVAKQGSLTTTALGSNAAFPELYWIGELQYTGSVCSFCKHQDLMWTNENCKNCLTKLYQQYRNKPACMLAAFAPYMQGGAALDQSMCGDELIVDELDATYSPVNLLHLPDGTSPLFSIEHSHSGPGLPPRGNLTMKEWREQQIANHPNNTCVQTDYHPGGICGTFDGFGNWEWEQFEAFMTLFAEEYNVDNIGIYEWQFVPEQWKGESYDPCAGKSNGDQCSYCRPGDSDCFETLQLKTCLDGVCQTNVSTTPGSAPAPTPDTPAPTPDTPAPTPDSPAPTPDSPAPTPDSPAPTPDSPAPTPDSPAPTPDSPAPTPDSPAPTPDSPAPGPYDPCQDKLNGDPCTKCSPNAKDCVETEEYKTCTGGKCSPWPQCQISMDCPNATDPYCGYDCMNGTCAMWCQGPSGPAPTPDSPTPTPDTPRSRTLTTFGSRGVAALTTIGAMITLVIVAALTVAFDSPKNKLKDEDASLDKERSPTSEYLRHRNIHF